MTTNSKSAASFLARQSASLPANTTWGDALSRRCWFLDAERLCEGARRRTGLEDFGDPLPQPALRILTESLEREAELHPLGRFLMWTHLRDLLETRLRLEDSWSERAADLASVPVERPVFILGMPRSGSTFLHELLSEDPENRAPRVWEVMFPLPNAATNRRLQHWLQRKAAARLWWFRRLAPKADAVFPMRAPTPHECVAIHSFTFLSEEFVSTCRIPTYEGFLRGADLQPMYLWQRRFLQHLQLHCRPRHWVLKSPDHVYGLEQLFQVFPDAFIIQTHRNPEEVFASSCRLTEVLQDLYARPGNREQREAREMKTLTEAMRRLRVFRETHPELSNRFVDVTYPELVCQPLAVISRIYEQLARRLSAFSAERMRLLAAARCRYRPSRAWAPWFESIFAQTTRYQAVQK